MVTQTSEPAVLFDRTTEAAQHREHHSPALGVRGAIRGRVNAVVIVLAGDARLRWLRQCGRMTDLPASQRYAPLAAFLTELPPETMTVTVTLAEIEQLIGRPLPRAAATRTWWQLRHDRERLRPWVVAGWRVAHTAMRTVPPTVTFVRMGVGAAD
jgi:hypothetical protein